MGWFSSSSSSPPPSTPTTPKPTSDGAFIAPDRSARDRCYEARDAFFACLDRAGIINSIEEAERADAECGALERGMGKECAASWVCSPPSFFFLGVEVVFLMVERLFTLFT